MSRLIIVLIVVLIATSTGCASSRSPASERPRTLAATNATPRPTPPGTSVSDCSFMTQGGFKDVWRNEQAHPRLGCAVAPADAITGTETFLCDGMHTLWLSEKRLFVVIPVWPDPWRFVVDESNLPGDMPLMEEPVPRSQPCFPVSGRHGWLVRLLNPDRSNKLRARTNETAFSGMIQKFKGGWLFWNGSVCFVLFEDSTWTIF